MRRSRAAPGSASGSRSRAARSDCGARRRDRRDVNTRPQPSRGIGRERLSRPGHRLAQGGLLVGEAESADMPRQCMNRPQKHAGVATPNQLCSAPQYPSRPLFFRFPDIALLAPMRNQYLPQLAGPSRIVNCRQRARKLPAVSVAFDLLEPRSPVARRTSSYSWNSMFKPSVSPGIGAADNHARSPQVLAKSSKSPPCPLKIPLRCFGASRRRSRSSDRSGCNDRRSRKTGT